MSLFDILGNNGPLGSILNNIGQSAGLGGSGFCGSSGGGLGSILGNLGNLANGGLGSVLGNLSDRARNARDDFDNTLSQKGGMGSMLGAGALGALLGNMAGGSLLKNAALLGAGAVALNFYKKWSEGKKAQQPGSQTANYQAQQPNQGYQATPSQAQPKELPQVDQQTVELITRAMVYASKSDGNIDKQERECMEAVLANMIPGLNQDEMIARIEQETVDPGKISSAVRSHEQGEDVYRLSCSVIEIDQFMERAYMDALAKSLDITDADKTNIEKEAATARQQLLAAVQPA